MKTYKGRPSIVMRERLRQLCNRTKHPNYNSTSYEKVFFPEFANELKSISPPSQKQYNCFAYALGLDVYVAKYTFILLIRNGDIILTAKPKKGDIVVYYGNDKAIKHAGIFESGSKVISKWDTGGPILLHDTFMCPNDYGNNVKFFRKVSRDMAEKLILKYPRPN